MSHSFSRAFCGSLLVGMFHCTEVLGGPATAPLLLIPGAFMATSSMTSWVSAFAATRTVIIFDQQGHGRASAVCTVRFTGDRASELW